MIFINKENGVFRDYVAYISNTSHKSDQVRFLASTKYGKINKAEHVLFFSSIISSYPKHWPRSLF